MRIRPLSGCRKSRFNGAFSLERYRLLLFEGTLGGALLLAQLVFQLVVETSALDDGAFELGRVFHQGGQNGFSCHGGDVFRRVITNRISGRFQDQLFAMLCVVMVLQAFVGGQDDDRLLICGAFKKSTFFDAALDDGNQRSVELAITVEENLKPGRVFVCDGL